LHFTQYSYFILKRSFLYTQIAAAYNTLCNTYAPQLYMDMTFKGPLIWGSYLAWHVLAPN